MVYPEIKIKEKNKSFSMKVRIAKEEVQGDVFTSEDVTELKRTILELISYKLDDLIVMMVEDEDLTFEQTQEMDNALSKVSVSVETEAQEEETEDVVEKLN
jgi:GTP cyclohydrolase II